MPISQAILPLRLVFWGGLLCVLDFTFSYSTTVNGHTSGVRFDILNDLLGMLLLTFGVYRLKQFDLDGKYRDYMRIVLVVSMINCVIALMDHFVFSRPTLLSVGEQLVSIVTLVATVLFCTAMMQLAQAYALHRSAESWQFTRLLVIVIWAIPFGLLYLSTLGALVVGESFPFSIGLLVIPVLLAMLVPLVHLFISTSRMKREAQHASPLEQAY
ncbi:hypothetical protein NG895_18410 [Aeoliella sp. ICT_H6.2]|uniref:Uncharacterized protein n=1 Tax=Aeoliella straminimaris TaxID=2954799 RepID=A0A9X2FD34_9BACT|nr:hypothetical protein [Aeoliella straminimaris]MCO6045877.1 hypothetical protein [Aeoliella straminimaris]